MHDRSPVRKVFDHAERSEQIHVERLGTGPSSYGIGKCTRRLHKGRRRAVRQRRERWLVMEGNGVDDARRQAPEAEEVGTDVGMRHAEQSALEVLNGPVLLGGQHGHGGNVPRIDLLECQRSGVLQQGDCRRQIRVHTGTRGASGDASEEVCTLDSAVDSDGIDDRGRRRKGTTVDGQLV